MLKISEPQPLETGVAYKKKTSTAQGNYTLFYKYKLRQNKETEIDKK